MFIRWQKRKSGRQLYRRETTRVAAILVERVRINGKSRQRHIAFIASYVVETLDAEARRAFWKKAHERLTIYVKNDDRNRIDAALARRVPPLPTEDDAAI